MPIKVPNDLPAVDLLTKENVFVMTDARAMTQDIRPLHILLLNLMPTKIETETQLTRLLGNTPLQIELELLQTKTHKAHVASQEHMLAFYKTFDEVRANYYDGMIITGAPVELMEFEEVDYWEELCEIMEWTKGHVHSTFHICWGAQAALYYHYGIPKIKLPSKLSGVFEHHLDYKNGMLFRGFDDSFYVPHSRNTTIRREDVEAIPELKIIASSEKAGVFAIKTQNDRQIFMMGHSEYDADTLMKEYIRDKKAGLNPHVPDNYFPNDDDTKEPVVRWRSCANLLYSNWINYFVYQTTPYDITTISNEDLTPAVPEGARMKVAKFGGTSLADAEQFRRVAEIVREDETRRYVVVSAPGKRWPEDTKVTDLLIRFAAGSAEALEQVEERFREIVEGLDVSIDIASEIEKIRKDYAEGASRDYVITRGEYLTAKILAEYLNYDFVDAQELILFDGEGGYLEKETRRRIDAMLRLHENAVVPGFYGINAESGRIIAFPRGGSDITGAIVAVGLKADIYENWTDVNGMLMADPAIVKNPLTVPVVTYNELRVLSATGAKVIHEDACLPVRKAGIPVNIRNTNAPDEPGTLIVKSAEYQQTPLKISGISGKPGYASIQVEKTGLSGDPEFPGHVSKILDEMGIKVINTVSGLDTQNILVKSKGVIAVLDELKRRICEEAGADMVFISTGIAIISVVSREMATSPAIGVRILGALAEKRINVKMIDYGIDGISIQVCVSEDEFIQSVRAIYAEFTRM